MIPPGVRRIDPDAEAARLAEERKQATGPWFLLAGAAAVMPGGERALIQLSATRPLLLPPGVMAKLADVLREHWPAGDAWAPGAGSRSCD